MDRTFPRYSNRVRFIRRDASERGSLVSFRLSADSPGVSRRDAFADHDRLNLIDHFFWALQTLPRKNLQQQQLDSQR